MRAVEIPQVFTSYASTTLGCCLCIRC